LAQLVRKARLGVDAILPGGTVSSQWSDEECVEIANVAYEEIWRRYRLARNKWGMVTVSQTDAAFTRDGETYTPSTALSFTGTTGGSSATNLVTLPPDFGEMVRILCLNNRTVRFLPTEIESYHYIDYEQRAFDLSGNTLLLNTPDGLVFHYDIVGNRSLAINPPTSGTFTLQISYIPMKRPLYFSVNGTVAQAGTALTGTSTTWVIDNIFTEDTNNAAELITLASGAVNLQNSLISMNQDYPRIKSLTSDTAAVMVQSATIAGGTNAIVAMSPALPRDVHRWIAEYMSALMLKKINPDMAEKFGMDILNRMDVTIRPTAGRRQLQEGKVTEDSEEMGITSAW
jgi:hypothetical protein